MYSEIFTALGGVGLFLLGMILLTEGLQGLAGHRLRHTLEQYTRTPLHGVLAGTVVTMILQSSSATTVTAIGFVGAGLLSFPQGLGIIFGANIGTTFTGWLVALLGFKLKLGLVALPLVFVGGLMRLFGGVKVEHAGAAVAGFALLFLGIDTMQAGMAGLEGVLTPDSFPDDTLAGRLLLVAIGAAITMVTQSSSAGVAAALVALDTGTISFAQAAAMVIGMNIGTTFTAALATIGGSVASRQTGAAHVVFNLGVGLFALLILTPFAALTEVWIAAKGAGAAQIALVSFHTLFNLVGVLAVLLIVRRFAALIRRLVPEKGPPLLARLDEALLRHPASAIDAAEATVRDVTAQLTGVLINLLGSTATARADRARLQEIVQALAATRHFVERVDPGPVEKPTRLRYRDVLHALDHLTRLAVRCRQSERIEILATERRLTRLRRVMREALITYFDDQQSMPQKVARFDRLQQLMQRQQAAYRSNTLNAATEGLIEADPAIERLDAIRWLHRASYHQWRILYHLNLLDIAHAAPTPAAAVAPPAELPEEVRLEEQADH